MHIHTRTARTTKHTMCSPIYVKLYYVLVCLDFPPRITFVKFNSVIFLVSFFFFHSVIQKLTYAKTLLINGKMRYHSLFPFSTYTAPINAYERMWSLIRFVVNEWLEVERMLILMIGLEGEPG